VQGGHPCPSALTHDLAVLSLQVSLPHLVGAFVVAAGNDSCSGCVPMARAPPRDPSPPHLSVSRSSSVGVRRVSERMLGVLRPLRLISTCSRSMKNLRNSCASCWLRQDGPMAPTAAPGPREAGELPGVPVAGGEASPVSSEGGHVFLKDGLEAPRVDSLGGVGVPEGGDDIGKGCGTHAGCQHQQGLGKSLGGQLQGAPVPPSVSSWGARGPGGCSCWKSRRRQ